MSEISKHLRGPWVAAMYGSDGFCETDPADLMDSFATVAVVRGSAAPTERDGGLRMPGVYAPGDVLYEVDDDIDDDDDAGTGLGARWEQAQAVAAALNALESGRG